MTGEDENLSEIYRVPRIVVPIESPDAHPIPTADYQPTVLEEPEKGKNSATDDPPEDLLYVMGGSRDGSIDPDNRTAPPAKSAIQTDTYKSWEPPLYADKVNVSSIGTGSTTTVNCSAAHNIPATGGPYLVIIAGVTGNTPSINGKWWATRTDADSFTIPLATTVAGTGGTVGLYCNGVKVNEWVRFYKVASSGGTAFNESVWTRSEKMWNRGQFYVSEETLANVATISGSGSGGGGL